jgi:alkanesulfonate monooxygenase SsuD/methylene tetrahydromethanopterin reductase-like flavin-dependent oxidoreductase (luciferase family)
VRVEGEAAGWDGVFFYDAICVGEMETYDPWIVMAAMAMTTTKSGAREKSV